MTENTLENKEYFFHAYGGQLVAIGNGGKTDFKPAELLQLKQALLTLSEDIKKVAEGL